MEDGAQGKEKAVTDKKVEIPVWQKAPVQVTGQEQVHAFSKSRQVPPLRHGLDAHSFTSVWQNKPEKPAGQVQRKRLMASRQVPPLRHGAEAHSLMLVRQALPEKPEGQEQT